MNERGECRNDVHMMCVGSVKAEVGSSSIPTVKASKCCLERSPFESQWRHFDAYRGGKGLKYEKSILILAGCCFGVFIQLDLRQ